MQSEAAGRFIRRMAETTIPEAGPGRTMFWAMLVNMAGSGMYLTSSALFFVRHVGLSAASVGLGLTIGRLTGLSASIPVGRLADRRGSREIYVLTLALEGVAMGLLVLVRQYWQFLLLISLVSLASSASSAALGPLVRHVGGQRPTLLRSYLRSATNLGYASGGIITAVVVATGARSGLPVLVLVNAGSFLVCGLMVRRLPHVEPMPPLTARKRLPALSDRGYLGVAAVNAVMMLQYPILTLIVPLWVYQATDLPHWVIGVVVPINTLLVVLLQVRMSRKVETPSDAARTMARAGGTLLLALAAFSAIGLVPPGAGVGLLLVAVIVYTIGEIWYASASYELSFGLAPAAAQGEYLGLYSLSGGLGQGFSQSITVLLCLSVGVTGWLVLGALLLVGGLAAVPVTAHAIRSR
jgi:hypothetical protein